MKTWEMFKELTENPDKKFRLIDEEDVKTISVYGEIKITGSSELFVDDEWEEVKQPVSFTEAVESGKKILVEHGRIPGYSSGYMGLHEMLKYLSDLPNMAAGIIIRNGDWYIED